MDPARILAGLSIPAAFAAAANGAVAAPLQAPAREAQAQSSREVEWGHAPDGERGFGEGRSVRDLTRLLRSPAAEDRGFTGTLYHLEDELKILLAMTTEHYKSSGYFDLVDIAAKEKRPATGSVEMPADPLERLHLVFRERATHASAVLQQGGPAADLFARLLVDTRFRIRARVLDGLDFEIADMKAGLAVLSAELDGFVGLHDGEADRIARRVDLAASRVRAAKLDLEALREDRKDGTIGETHGKDLEALFELIRTDDADRRARELPEALDRLEQREQDMASALFTTRLETKLETKFEERRKDLATADDRTARVRALFTGSGEGEKPDARRMSKNQRYTEASRLATEGLFADPLCEELCWFEGETSDFIQGSIESKRFFDRYLALRGIRVHDHRTYKDRALSREEKRAIDVVQAVGAAPQGSQPGAGATPPQPK